jgi:hypothetical protein
MTGARTLARKRTIVVLFHARHQGLPLRATNEMHLKAWGRYAQHHVIYINVGYAIPWSLLRMATIDALIFDTTFCSMHWTPEYFRARTALCAEAAHLTCPKIAIVQDEFTNIDLVSGFLEEIGITHILTCSKEDDWGKFYPRLVNQSVTLKPVAFRTVLTGYVDPSLAASPSLPPSQRPIAIGYKGGHNPFWLGRHGQLKSAIGEKVRDAAEVRHLTVDITHPDAVSYLKGDAWFDFLRQCRCVLGVEGGASINDHDGRVRQAVEAYLAAHPDAGFDAVKAACFAERDGEVDLACLSPRHFEAAATRTAQLLVEGHYNGVLKPWEHYIPLKPDFSNLDEALAIVMDDTAVDAMVERAYNDVIMSGEWSYAAFVRNIETSVIEAAPASSLRNPISRALARWILQCRNGVLWRLASLEATAGFGRIVSRIALFARRLETVGFLGSAIRTLRTRARHVLGINPDKGTHTPRIGTDDGA